MVNRSIRLSLSYIILLRKSVKNKTFPGVSLDPTSIQRSQERDSDSCAAEFEFQTRIVAGHTHLSGDATPPLCGSRHANRSEAAERIKGRGSCIREGRDVYVDKSVRQAPTVFPPFLFLLVQPLHHLFFYSPQASSSSFSLRDAHARELRGCVSLCTSRIFTRTLYQRAARQTEALFLGAVRASIRFHARKGITKASKLLEATGIYDILGTRSRDLKRNGFKSLGRRKFLIPLSRASFRISFAFSQRGCRERPRRVR